MPPMEKRGIFASDDSLTKEIIREADAAATDPFFFFTVTLQGHGPYEANRYAKNTIKIEGNLPRGRPRARSRPTRRASRKPTTA